MSCKPDVAPVFRCPDGYLEGGSGAGGTWCWKAGVPPKDSNGKEINFPNDNLWACGAIKNSQHYWRSVALGSPCPTGGVCATVSGDPRFSGNYCVFEKQNICPAGYELRNLAVIGPRCVYPHSSPVGDGKTDPRQDNGGAINPETPEQPLGKWYDFTPRWFPEVNENLFNTQTKADKCQRCATAFDPVTNAVSGGTDCRLSYKRKNEFDAYQHSIRTSDLNRKGIDNETGRYTQIGTVFNMKEQDGKVDFSNPQAVTQTVYANHETRDNGTSLDSNLPITAVRYKTHPAYKGLIWHAIHNNNNGCSANQNALVDAQRHPWATNFSRLWTGVAGVNAKASDTSNLSFQLGNYPRGSFPNTNCNDKKWVQHPENPMLKQRTCPYIPWPTQNKGGNLYDEGQKYPAVNWDGNMSTNPLFKHIKFPGTSIGFTEGTANLGNKNCVGGLGSQFLLAREFDAANSCATIGRVKGADAAANGLKRVLKRENVSINSEDDAKAALSIVSDSKSVIFQDAASDPSTVATMPDLQVTGLHSGKAGVLSNAPLTGHGWCEYPVSKFKSVNTLSTPAHVKDFIERTTVRKDYINDPLPDIDSDFAQLLLYHGCSMEYNHGEVAGHACDHKLGVRNNRCSIYFSSGSETNRTAGYLCRQHLKKIPGVTIQGEVIKDSLGVPLRIKDAMIRQFCRVDNATTGSTTTDMKCTTRGIAEKSDPAVGDYTEATLPESCRCIRAGMLSEFIQAATSKDQGTCASMYPQRACFWGPCQMTSLASPDNDFTYLRTSDINTATDDCPSVCFNTTSITGTSNIVISAGQTVACTRATSTDGTTVETKEVTGPSPQDTQDVLDQVENTLRQRNILEDPSFWEENKVYIGIGIAIIVCVIIIIAMVVLSNKKKSKK